MRTYAAQGSVSDAFLGEATHRLPGVPRVSHPRREPYCVSSTLRPERFRTRNGSPAARHTTSRGHARDRHPTRIKNCPQGAVSSLPLTDHLYGKIL